MCIRLDFSRLMILCNNFAENSPVMLGVERGYQLRLDPILPCLEDESGTNDGCSRVHGGPFLGPDDTPVDASGIRFRLRFLCGGANDDSTESEKSVERKRRARTKRVGFATAEEREEKQLLCVEEGEKEWVRKSYAETIRRRIHPGPDKPRITGCHLSAEGARDARMKFRRKLIVCWTEPVMRIRGSPSWTLGIFWDTPDKFLSNTAYFWKHKCRK